MAMSAHILYRAIDPDHPATQSPIVVETIIREEIGFTGLLMTDDLNMKALVGGLGERADSAFNAGCDIVLHGSGDLGEMTEVATGLRPLSDLSEERAEKALERLVSPDPLEDPSVAEQLIAEALGSGTLA